MAKTAVGARDERVGFVEGIEVERRRVPDFYCIFSSFFPSPVRRLLLIQKKKWRKKVILTKKEGKEEKNTEKAPPLYHELHVARHLSPDETAESSATVFALECPSRCHGLLILGPMFRLKTHEVVRSRVRIVSASCPHSQSDVVDGACSGQPNAHRSSHRSFPSSRRRLSQHPFRKL